MIPDLKTKKTSKLLLKNSLYSALICCLLLSKHFEKMKPHHRLLLLSYTFPSSGVRRGICAWKFLIFTLFCSLQRLRSLSSRRRAAEAHCAASLRMRLFMKLRDSLPVPTCSSSIPMSDWNTAWVKREKKGIVKYNNNCTEIQLFHELIFNLALYM